MKIEILSISIGGIISIALERMVMFQSLTSRQKFIAVVVTCVVTVHVLFLFKEAFIGRLPISAEEFARSVEMSLVAIFASQLTHVLERRLW